MFTSRRLAGMPTTFSPCSRIRPPVGSSKPPIMRSVVVLPQPDGPSIEKKSPSRISTLTPSTAATGPSAVRNSLRTSISSIAVARSTLGSAVGGSVVCGATGLTMSCDSPPLENVLTTSVPATAWLVKCEVAVGANAPLQDPHTAETHRPKTPTPPRRTP